MANDVAQSVFIDLARKAERLSRRSVLSGWLYKSACFAAANTVRAERLRIKRETAVQAMQVYRVDAALKPDWGRISPFPNPVMLGLKAIDREVLILRFFERRSLAQAGAKVGLGENAARMRVERALDRLRQLLMRHGIDSTAASLGFVLTQQGVTAAPFGPAASITATSLAAVAASGWASLTGLISLRNLNVLFCGTPLLAGAAFEPSTIRSWLRQTRFQRESSIIPPPS